MISCTLLSFKKMLQVSPKARNHLRWFQEHTANERVHDGQEILGLLTFSRSVRGDMWTYHWVAQCALQRQRAEVGSSRKGWQEGLQEDSPISS